MANLNDSMPRNIPRPDPLGVLGTLGILSSSRLEKVRNKILSGELPSEFEALVKRLVGERLLTSYQTRTILLGRAKELVLGPYILLRPVARGEMGRVYKAYHRMLGRVVAIKVVAASAPSPRAISRFRREMRLVGRLDHPNIVVAYDAGRRTRVFFFAMEYLSGSTLQDLLDLRGPLPPSQVVRYAADVASGLAHAHSRGIVHRDVKPANILLSEGERIKILDLGIGVLMDESDGVTRGEVGKLSGTVEYISPEQACQKRLDGRSDLYSLGCTIYHLIRGQAPFSDRPWVERVAIRVTGDHEPITHDLADDPPGLVAVMDKLLAHNPEDRFQTADEAADALLGLVRAEHAPSGLTRVQSRRSWMSPSADGRWSATGWRRALTAAAILLALGFGYLSLAATSKHALPEISSQRSARSTRQVDEIDTPPATERAMTLGLADERSRVEPSLLRGIPSSPVAVAERPSVKWSQGRALARLASILPSDLAFIAGITRLKPVAAQRMATVHDPALGPPEKADVGHDRAVIAPAPLPEPGNSRTTAPLLRHRADRAPIAVEAEKLTPTLMEPPLKQGEGESPRAETLTEQKDLTRPPRIADRAPFKPGPTREPATKASREPKTATIHVFMPSRNSELVVSGAVGRGNPDEWYGSKRVIHTPPFNGATKYIVGAFWTDTSGKPSIRQTELKVDPGHVYQVDLRPEVPKLTEVSE